MQLWKAQDQVVEADKTIAKVSKEIENLQIVLENQVAAMAAASGKKAEAREEVTFGKPGGFKGPETRKEMAQVQGLTKWRRRNRTREFIDPPESLDNLLDDEDDEQSHTTASIATATIQERLSEVTFNG